MTHHISQVALLVRNYDEAVRFSLLAKAATTEQEHAVGNQTRGHFMEEPRQEPYGTVVVFLDLYGNKWDLIGPATPS